MPTLDADLVIAPPAPSVAPPRRSRALPRDRINGQPSFVLHSYPYKETKIGRAHV